MYLRKLIASLSFGVVVLLGGCGGSPAETYEGVITEAMTDVFKHTLALVEILNDVEDVDSAKRAATLIDRNTESMRSSVLRNVERGWALGDELDLVERKRIEDRLDVKLQGQVAEFQAKLDASIERLEKSGIFEKPGIMEALEPSLINFSRVFPEVVQALSEGDS